MVAVYGSMKPGIVWSKACAERKMGSARGEPAWFLSIGRFDTSRPVSMADGVQEITVPVPVPSGLGGT